MASSWAEGRRPLSVAILALGGEGGGVLADWIVATAEGAGFHAQTTSVAGVAQRTGATVYYLEMLPHASERDGEERPRPREQPVMSIFPTPGEVDVVIASELMESGRAVQRGFSTADRTTLITSTNRVYSIDEKIALGDGRVDDEKLLEGARRASKRLVAEDFMALAEDAGSVISSSLLGALAGSEALPFSREAYEEAIRASGRGVDASLAAFAAGYEAAKRGEEAAVNGAPSEPVELTVLPGGSPATLDATSANLTPPTPSSRVSEAGKSKQEKERNEIAATNPASLVGPGLRDLAERVREFPAASRSMTLYGLVRTAVFQSHDYAALYLERVGRFAAAEGDRDGDAELTREAARHVGLWMAYQDTIQVAQQKLRQGRMARIREESKLRDNQVMEVREYLHPQIDEIIDTLPTWIGHPLSRSQTFRKVVHATTHKGMRLNTSSVWGQSLLGVLARVRPLRPRSVRFVREQEEIERWIGKALAVAATDQALATEIVKLQHVLKGYGSTYEHGSESFALLMEAADKLAGSDGAAERLADLHEAALADETGVALREKLAEPQPAPA
jgi:indolepyruvate ferredoxin oxidoreductase, beta subunit